MAFILVTRRYNSYGSKAYCHYDGRDDLAGGKASLLEAVNWLSIWAEE